MTTNKMLGDITFDLNRASEMVDTLSLAVEDAQVALESGDGDPARATDADAEVIKRLDADDNFLLQARTAIREAGEWIKAMQDNSVLMLRFQRHVDEHIGPYDRM